MNEFLASRFVENITRLALGLTPIDAGRQALVTHPIDVAIEGPPLPDRLLTHLAATGRTVADRWRRITRHPSAVYVLLYEPALDLDHLDLRLVDPAQRIVPRRLRVPLTTIATATDPALLDGIPIGSRSRRPTVFPGAAYDATGRATGLRGRAVRADPTDPNTPKRRIPVRWPRVVARASGTQTVIGRAQGDQNGEFLLLLTAQAIPGVAIPAQLTADVDVSAPPAALVPPSALLPPVDAYWDVPLESLAAPGAADPVADGTVMPAGYTRTVTQSVPFQYGMLVSSGIPSFDLT